MRASLRHNLLTGILSAIIGGMGFCASANGAMVLETVYFDIDFSSPLHHVGSKPTINAGPAAPSFISFGSPEVVSGLGSLVDQPVVLNTAGNSGVGYDQFVLSLAHQQRTYHFSCDLFLIGMIGSANEFSIFFDHKGSARLGFYTSGVLYPPSFPGPSPLPKFVDETLLHIDVSLDLFNNRSVTLVNGVVIGDGQAIGNSAPGDLRSVRFSLTGSGSATIGIDNIRVTNGFVVPECGMPALLMMSAGFWLACCGRHRCTAPAQAYPITQER